MWTRSEDEAPPRPSQGIGSLRLSRSPRSTSRFGFEKIIQLGVEKGWVMESRVVWADYLFHFHFNALKLKCPIIHLKRPSQTPSRPSGWGLRCLSPHSLPWLYDSSFPFTVNCCPIHIMCPDQRAQSHPSFIISNWHMGVYAGAKGGKNQNFSSPFLGVGRKGVAVWVLRVRAALAQMPLWGPGSMRWDHHNTCTNGIPRAKGVTAGEWKNINWSTEQKNRNPGA